MPDESQNGTTLLAKGGADHRKRINLGLYVGRSLAPCSHARRSLHNEDAAVFERRFGIPDRRRWRISWHEAYR